MNKKDLAAVWNQLLSEGEEPFQIGSRQFPRYRLQIGKRIEVTRKYIDGSLRYRSEVVLRAEAVCVCRFEEEALIEDLHRRADLLCDYLPAPLSGEELLYCEMIHRPHITDRSTGVCAVETTLRITARKSGKKKGVVFFLGKDSRAIYPPCGFFDVSLERQGGEKRSLYMDEPSIRGYLTAAETRMQFCFDRIVGAQGQELILTMADRAALGAKAIVQVYFADIDAGKDGEYPCVRRPMSVKIDRMSAEDEGTVFGGCMLGCGKAESGTLRVDAEGRGEFSVLAPGQSEGADG